MKKINKNALTLVELVISILITVIILIPLITFISETNNEISSSQEKTKAQKIIFDIKYKIWDIKQEYLSGEILIDNDSASWSDVLVFKTIPSETKKAWYAFGLVDYDSLKLDWKNSIDNIWEKYFWYRKLSETELNELDSNPDKIYDYKFHRDKIFKWLVLKNFQVEKYNDNIYELIFEQYTDFSKSSQKKSYKKEVPKKFIEKFILDY